MKINLGHPVVDDNFFGRNKELERMREVLQNKKASIFIPGPRRIGKSSIVKEFIRRNRDKYSCIYFDLEGRNSIIEFCNDLMKEIGKVFPQQIKSKKKLKEKWNILSKILPKIEIGGVIKLETGELPIPAKELLDQMEGIFEEIKEYQFILALDEFSDFIWKLKEKDINDVILFLEWTRRLSQGEKIQMIITGSVNIVSTLEELNLIQLINTLTDVDILPLDENEIKDLLSDLLKDKNVSFTDDSLNFALSKLSEGIPFYIQLFADKISYYNDVNIPKIDLFQTKKLYKKIIDIRHKEFIYFHERLKTYVSMIEYKAVTKILINIACDRMSFDDLWPYIEEMLPDKESLAKLLKRLEDECYLKKENTKYMFVSPMLADWWKNTYEYEK